MSLADEINRVMLLIDPELANYRPMEKDLVEELKPGSIFTIVGREKVRAQSYKELRSLIAEKWPTIKCQTTGSVWWVWNGVLTCFQEMAKGYDTAAISIRREYFVNYLVLNTHIAWDERKHGIQTDDLDPDLISLYENKLGHINHAQMIVKYLLGKAIPANEVTKAIGAPLMRFGHIDRWLDFLTLAKRLDVLSHVILFCDGIRIIPGAEKHDRIMDDILYMKDSMVKAGISLVIGWDGWKEVSDDLPEKHQRFRELLESTIFLE